jgi:hypothetical protein
VDVDTFNMPAFKKPEWTFARPDWTMTAKKNDPLQRPIGQTDLIGPDGRCAGEAAPAAPAQALNFTAGPDATRPNQPAPGLPPEQAPPQSMVRGVGLGMSECDVVSVLGHTDQIQVTGTQGGQREVVLTYVQGPRPGVYRFAAGRLVSIERGPEAPAPVKPDKKVAKKKPANS